MSANLERAAGDAVIADFLRRNQEGVEATFAQALQREQANGELSRKQDPEALARFLVVAIQGMRALARLKSDRRARREAARVAQALFD